MIKSLVLRALEGQEQVDAEIELIQVHDSPLYLTDGVHTISAATLKEYLEMGCEPIAKGTNLSRNHFYLHMRRVESLFGQSGQPPRSTTLQKGTPLFVIRKSRVKLEFIGSSNYLGPVLLIEEHTLDRLRLPREVTTLLVVEDEVLGQRLKMVRKRLLAQCFREYEREVRQADTDQLASMVSKSGIEMSRLQAPPFFEVDRDGRLLRAGHDQRGAVVSEYGLRAKQFYQFTSSDAFVTEGKGDATVSQKFMKEVASLLRREKKNSRLYQQVIGEEEEKEDSGIEGSQIEIECEPEAEDMAFPPPTSQAPREATGLFVKADEEHQRMLFKMIEDLEREEQQEQPHQKMEQEPARTDRQPEQAESQQSEEQQFLMGHYKRKLLIQQ